MSKQIITEILSHDVSWYVDKKGVTDLAGAEEDIERMIKDGYTSGELHLSYGKNNEKTTSGWWHIINWRDIALQLRNSIVAVKEGTGEVLKEGQKEAVKRFDKEWTF